MIDLYEKEHKAYSDSAHTPEHEDESLRNQLIQSPEDTEASFLVNSATYFRRNGSDHTAIKMQGKEERYRADAQITILLSPLDSFFPMSSWQVGGICFL